MMARRCYVWLPSIVLAAIVGIVSVAGEASACSVKRAGKAPSACCAGRGQSACRCEVAKSDSTDRILLRTPNDGVLFAPTSSCECRCGDPNDPAPKPESPSFQHRTDQNCIRFIEPICEIRPAIAFVRLVLPTESPPGTPLYLHTSRLLI